jgi:hypothetical protein
MSIKSIVDCSDLYDNAAEKLKRLDNDIDKNVRDLAERVEARGVPKNKVARQVVRELTARGVLSPSRIYEALGIEHKRKFKKRVIEGTFPQVENYVRKESSTPKTVLLTASSTGQSEILEDTNGGPDIELGYEEQKKKGVPTHEDERLKEKGEEKDQVSELRKENESVKKEHQLEFLRVLQEKFYDEPGILDANKLHKVSESVGKELVILLGHYNSILKDATESGQPVPMGTYIMTKPEKKPVPIRILIDFDRRTIRIELWRKKLQRLT